MEIRQTYPAEKKIDYPVMVGNDRVSKSYGDLHSLPTTFIIGRDRKSLSSKWDWW